MWNRQVDSRSDLTDRTRAVLITDGGFVPTGLVLVADRKSPLRPFCQRFSDGIWQCIFIFSQKIEDRYWCSKAILLSKLVHVKFAT